MGVEIKSFELNIDPIPFTLNRKSEDIYFAVPDLPLGLMGHLSKFRNITKNTENFDVNELLSIFDELLVEESAQLVRKRVEEKMFGVKAMMTVIPWLIEQYGLRPTQPSLPSLSGSDGDETGMNSTGGALVEVSIPLSFQDHAP